ncbi:CocE/NonD family hydrolase [Alkalicoccobacillus murimartini]|uniref:CocE/NonD family hydrolase n=1 Tax=Alkalicoccobacillus murimartini TaxID=171685 RepID=A0ABT9YEW9_9BACI|nr:CocE/NonD family hydrolase [Alkalicoccobacillus murimartini]MDQ0205752.1 putative CocE/NonD family hydrolase [Alkalicoccobacillus murimartini]
MVFNVRDSKLHIKKQFPHNVREVENVWIPMSDGTKLSAKIWLPEDAEQNPVPAILEYLPYRKNDFTALRDSIRHPYFAGHGYASIRVDMRGSGDSDGILYDEYLPQEQEDALEILQWIEKQDWSTGRVGMIGKSWGGFNGLQVASHQPKQLKAVITLCSTDDRYADDVHYMGGNILASDMLWWSSTMLAYNARPADPMYVGDEWKKKWLERLEHTPPFVEEWLNHQHRDEYWKQGSVCENYDDINIPVFAVGGWTDGYTNAIFRLLEGLNGPKKGLIGPWAHEYPEVAVPGPSIGFLQECLRWWDQWLKDEDTGIMDEPLLRAWMQDSVPPDVDYDERPGRWVEEEVWPPQSGINKEYYLGESTLSESAEKKSSVSVSSVQQHGLYSGVWCPFGQPGDLASDQRMEDGLSVSFTTNPLSEDLELLGFPKMEVEFSSDQPDALLAVRLCDIAPTGESTLVSWGMLNLNHLDGHEFPKELVPGTVYTADVQLNAIGQRIPAGHRLQVSLSPTYWPHAWPSKKPVTLNVITGEKTKLTLPIRPINEDEEDHWPFQAPEAAPVAEKEILRDESRSRTIHYDLLTKEWILDDFSDEGARKIVKNGVEYGSTNRNTYSIKEGDPLSAKASCEWTLTVGREEWQTRLETFSVMTADENHFYLENVVIAYESEEEIFSKTWKKIIQRNFQ